MAQAKEITYPHEYKPWGIFGKTYIIKNKEIHSKIKKNDNISYVIMITLSIIALNTLKPVEASITTAITLAAGIFINKLISDKITQ